MLHFRRLGILAISMVMLLATTAVASAEEYTPVHPSQLVTCAIVDNTLAQLPHGNGDGVVTEDETGPGGWRYNGGGRSFVTFAYNLNVAEDGYGVVAGRSNVRGNTGTINDYPAVLDLPQSSTDDVLEFNGRHGVIVVSGGDLFNLPGQDNGEVRINMTRVGTSDDGGHIYEGCAKTPQITNFGFTVQEGGDFVQQEYFKAYAETDSTGTVTFYEWTEVSTFNNTNPDAY
ncbi:hypothetical protein BH23CHL2_BH23CHL2_10430 [soil metagenome]